MILGHALSMSITLAPRELALRYLKNLNFNLLTKKSVIKSIKETMSNYLQHFQESACGIISPMHGQQDTCDFTSPFSQEVVNRMMHMDGINFQ